MSRARKAGSRQSRELTVERGRSFSQKLTNWIMFSTVVILILYGLIHLLVRTEGFARIVSERLEKKLGMPVSIKRVATDWNLKLLLQDTSAGNTKTQKEPSFVADFVKVGWYPGFGTPKVGWLRSVDVDGLHVTLTGSKSKEWQPSIFAPLSEYLSWWSPSSSLKTRRKEPTTFEWQKMDVSIKGMEVTWRVGRGEELAYAGGISAVAYGVETRDLQLHVCDLFVERALLGSGERIADVSFKMLSTETYMVVNEFKGRLLKLQNGARKALRRSPRTIDEREIFIAGGLEELGKFVRPILQAKK